LLKYWNDLTQSDNILYSSKSDLSPVTAVDLEVEKVIREIILKTFPAHTIIGEEYGKEGDSISSFIWLIDPIDGTKNYVRGLRQFATQVAVFCDDVPVVGVSSAPALNELVVAYKGGGAFLNKKRIQVSSVKSISDSFISHGGIKYFMKNKNLSQLVKLCEQGWSNRGFGDFWSYHLLADGRIEAMLEAETNLWDIAAVRLIVEEAGGKVTDLQGYPITNSPTSVLATNGLIHDKILNVFVK
jgi:histidinol-phosphatase